MLEDFHLESVKDPLDEAHRKLLRFLYFLIHGLHLFEEPVLNHIIKLIVFLDCGALSNIWVLLALYVQFLLQILPKFLVIQLKLADLVPHMRQLGLLLHLRLTLLSQTFPITLLDLGYF